MSGWEQYRKSRTTWGINVLGSFCVEIEASDGTKGFATGFGGPPACWLTQQHFERFLIGADPRDTNNLFELMYRGSMFYGRKGLAVAVISAIDLAIWDLLGKIRNEPVYKMIGGATRTRLNFYCTGPEPLAAKEAGFIGAKVPLPYGPAEPAGLAKNIAFLKKHREAVGPDFPLRVDCYMSLNVPYTIDLVTAANREDLRIDWWEECLTPDDFDGFQQLKRAHPTTRFTTGEHEYSRYGFRKLIEGRNLDILQPDVMWLGEKKLVPPFELFLLTNVKRRHDRVAKGGRYGISVRHSGSAARQRTIQLSLCRLPKQQPVPGVSPEQS